MQPKDIRLGLASARSAFADERGIWVTAGVGRLVDVWAEEFRDFTLAMSHAPRRMPYHDHLLKIDPGKYLPMPWLESVARGFHKALGCRRAIRHLESRSDVVVVQLPFAAPLALLGARTPRVYHLCTDILGNARSVYHGVTRLPALAVGRAIDSLQRRLLYNPSVRSVSNGEALFEHYGCPPGRAVVSASLSEREILSVPRRRPADAPFRVLFAGFIRYEKGIDTLLDAYERMLVEIPNAELVIVGGRSMVDRGMSDLLDRRATELNRKGSVTLLGHVDFGPELFQVFADADVLALPSRAEGTPRVLIEARAFGCTVVGTRAGGIPLSIEHERDGLLIDPDNPEALAQSLARIYREPDLRRRLVENGIARARRTTVEGYARAIRDEVLAVYADSHPQVAADHP